MMRLERSIAVASALFMLGGLLPHAEAHTTVPAGQTFTCGAGFGATTFGVSTHGNVVRIESPAGVEHVLVATPRSGYKVCYSNGGPFVASFDFGGTEAGWAAGVSVSQPNGAGTFPLEISRTTSDGAVTLTRRITGNSFVGPAPVGGTFDTENLNGVGCDSLGECGNCTNRTIHVLTRVRNNTGGPLTVRVLELANLQISGTPADDRFFRTNDSVGGFEDLSDAGATSASRGVLMQTLITPASTGVQAAGGFGSPGAADCAVPTIATPTAPGDFEGALSQEVVIGPGATVTGNIRIHYRRY